MEPSKNKARWKLFAVILVCASPIILSYFMYYVVKPQSRTNYGTLIDPRNYPIPELGTVALDGKPLALEVYAGKWIMLLVSGAECPTTCQEKLHDMRQLRLAQGKEMERIERVWLITDDEHLDTMLMREYDGTHMLRSKLDAVRGWLPVDEGTTVFNHIYMIDPLGNLMMRFPKDADPNKIKKDIVKLLKASSIG